MTLEETLYRIISPTANGVCLKTIGGDEPDHQYSYAEFRQRTLAFAEAVKQSGLKVGDCVGVLAANHHDYMAAFLGASAAGFTVSPINWKAGKDTVAFVCQDADLRLVIADPAFDDYLPANVARLYFSAIPATPQGAEADFSHDNELACIMYTSGSTGRPKGVPLTHAGYNWAVDQYRDMDSDEVQPRALISAPLYHMNGQCDFMINLAHGSQITLMRRFDVDLLLKTIETDSIASIGGVPTMLAMMIDRIDNGQNLDTRSVTSISVGSAPLSAQLTQRIHTAFPNATIYNGYGTTETGFVSFGPHPEGKPRPAISIGYPMPGIDIRLGACTESDEGECILRTPMMSKGYLNRPEATRKRFVNGWYHTGDLMRRDEDGFHYIIGRADDMFICGGENIFPGSVEQDLESHPGVAQAAVVSIPDDTKGTIPVAFIVKMAGHAPSEAALKAYMIEKGPAYAHPRHIHFMDALPLASTNKIAKSALQARALELFA